MWQCVQGPRTRSFLGKCFNPYHGCIHDPYRDDSKDDEILQNSFKRPEDIEKCIRTLAHYGKIGVDNYKDFAHSLLYIEESEQFHELSK